MKIFTDVQMQQSKRIAEAVTTETAKLELDAANKKLAKINDSKRHMRIQNNTPKERISTEGKADEHNKGVPKSTIRKKSHKWIHDEVTGMLPNLRYHAKGSRSKAVFIIRDLIREVENEYGLDGFFSEIAEEFDPHVSAWQCMVGNIKNRLASLADCYSDTARMQRDIIIASWYPDKDSRLISKCLEAAGVTRGSQPQRRAKIASAKFDAVAARRRRPPQVGDPVLCHGVLVKLIQLPDAAFSKADEGKPIAIADGKVQIDGADRFVEWGGAVPKNCNAKIDTVDPQLQGAVILDTGRKLKNPADPTTGKKCIVEVTGEGLSAQPEFAHTGWSAGGARIHHTTLDLSSWQARTKPFSAQILAAVSAFYKANLVTSPCTKDICHHRVERWLRHEAPMAVMHGTFKEMYNEFIAAHPQYANLISKRKFEDLAPFNVRKVKREGCLCLTCENYAMVMKAIRKLGPQLRLLLKGKPPKATSNVPVLDSDPESNEDGAEARAGGDGDGEAQAGGDDDGEARAGGDGDREAQAGGDGDGNGDAPLLWVDEKPRRREIVEKLVKMCEAEHKKDHMDIFLCPVVRVPFKRGYALPIRLSAPAFFYIIVFIASCIFFNIQER
jgi:hypothetical protein